MKQPIDTGDTVHHKPSGENWIVACVEGDQLSWCGWPEGIAKLSDCELVEKATDEQRDLQLNEWAKPGGCEKDRDHRHLYARHRLGIKDQQ